MVNPNIIVLGEYCTTHTPLLVKCAKCGYEWDASPANLLRHSGCPKCANRIRKTQEEFVKELSEKHPQLIVTGAYINNRTPIKIKCSKCNYEKQYNPYKILNKKEPCPNCKKRRLEAEKKEKKQISEDKRINRQELHEQNRIKREQLFLEKLASINQNIIPIEPYVSYNAKIKCRCMICGEEWLVTPAHLLSKRGCPVCSRKRGNLLRRKTHESYMAELELKNPNIELLSEYKGASEKVKCRCKVCNNIWEGRAYNLLANHGCPECGKKKVALAQSFTQKEFVERVQKNNPNVLVLGKFRTTVKPVKCKCKKCGKIWFPICELFSPHRDCETERILEEDTVSVYGEINGVKEYFCIHRKKGEKYVLC